LNRFSRNDTLHFEYAIALLTAVSRLTIDDSVHHSNGRFHLTSAKITAKISVMIIATCVLTLQLNDVHSLKEKRSIIKSIIARLRQQFNIAVAEVAHHDVWQTAVLGLATVGNDRAHVHGLLEKAVGWVEKQRPDIPLYDYSIEII
jgi:uncharacterized protein YlxP (DUF503 family)